MDFAAFHDARRGLRRYNQCAEVAAMIEIALGVLLTVGLFTRVAAFIASGQMAGAYVIGHLPSDFWPDVNGGSEAILYCFMFFYLAFAGAGAWSIDALRAVRRAG